MYVWTTRKQDDEKPSENPFAFVVERIAAGRIKATRVRKTKTNPSLNPPFFPPFPPVHCPPVRAAHDKSKNKNDKKKIENLNENCHVPHAFFFQLGYNFQISSFILLLLLESLLKTLALIAEECEQEQIDWVERRWEGLYMIHFPNLFCNYHVADLFHT